jgi:hypothetical protein
LSGFNEKLVSPKDDAKLLKGSSFFANLTTAAYVSGDASADALIHFPKK